MEFKNYKKIMYPFILINFNIYDKYYEYFNNLYISTYDFITYRNKTIANIKLNHDKLSYNDIIFIKISEKIFDLSLIILKNIIFSILFYSDITHSRIQLLHYDKVKENNLEDTFEYGIIYNFLNQQGVHVRSSFTLELYNIIKKYMTYEVFKKHVPNEYLVDENKYNECKEYVLNIITINYKNIRDTADSQTFQSTLIYLYEFTLDHFKFKPEYINHHDVISEQETNITVESKDIATEIFLNIDSINEINEEIELKGKRTSNSTDAERRLPMIWSKDDKTGECDVPDCASLGSNYKPDQVELGVDDQLKNGYSLVNHYKKAINLRNKYNFIQDAIFENLTVSIASQDDHVLLYKLTNGDDSIIVCHNFNDSARQVEIGDISTEILDSINTTKKIPELNAGKLSLGGYSTVILNVK